VSIRLYIRDDIVNREYLAMQRGIDKFSCTKGYVEHEGLTLLLDGDGRLFFQLKEEIPHPTIVIPRALRRHVELISWWTHIPSSPHRTLGQYELSDSGVEAQLDAERHDPEWRRLIIWGQDMVPMLRLYSEIRSGKAVPVESWDGEMTQSQLYAKLSQLLPPPGE
jgi:hypothetical protein